MRLTIKSKSIIIKSSKKTERKVKRAEIMIKSMTGFGRCEIAESERKFIVEMKGVNHRYLDVNIRMPKS